MPTFEITSPDGRRFRVTGPEGSTAEQALEQVKRQAGAGAAAPAAEASAEPAAAAPLPEPVQRVLDAAKMIPGPGGLIAHVAGTDVGRQAVKNLVPSAVQFVRDTVQPIIHPIDTAEAIGKVGAGVLEKTGIKSGEENVQYADAVGKFFADRYGGIENVKRTLATDPVGFAADLSTVLSAGGGAAARAPGVVGQVGRAAAAAGRAVDPLTAVGAAVKGAGAAASEAIGGLGTHTGGESIRTAYRAGQEGGAAAQAFQDNLRGVQPMEETVDAARQAVKTIRDQRGAAYRSGMTAVGADKTVLDWTKVDDALVDIAGVKTYKGQIISPKTQDIRLEIGNAVREWKALDPAEFHTPEGMDALKQKIGDIRDATERGTPARLIADRAYNAIRSTIIDQVPEYAKIMKGYEAATAQIKEIERTLSLNPNATIDTALRKLQSTLRDNVNTSFGRRRELAQFLVDAGAPNLMERLAGQALKPWTPRGLAKLLAGEIALTNPKWLLGLMSPRAVGEGAYYAGKATNLPLRAAGDVAFQTGRIAQQIDPRAMVREDAKAALRDAPEKRFSSDQIRALRAVAAGRGGVDAVMAAKRALETASSRAERGYGGVQ